MIKESLFKITLYYFVRNCEYLGYIKPSLNQFIIKALLSPRVCFLFRVAEEYRYIEFNEALLSIKPIEVVTREPIDLILLEESVKKYKEKKVQDD